MSRNIDISNSLIFEIKPGFTQSHFDVHEKSKSFENQANDMLFWITWIIGNLVYVKTYHTQNHFQVLDHDYTKLTFSFPINSLRARWSKRTCQDSSCRCSTSSRHPPTIKVPNLNKRKKQEAKWKKNYDLFIMHFEFWINPNKRNLHQRNEKSETLEKEKSEVINHFSSRN